MLRGALSILLATTILACPFVCRAGADSSADGASINSTCCHRHHGSESKGDQSTPSNSENHDGPECQCVCSGAVVKYAKPFDARPEVIYPATLPVVALLGAPSFNGLLAGRFEAPPPTGSANPGRALCCLYNTYLI
jgi:hypothetical protein